jgi:hypothetical protein
MTLASRKTRGMKTQALIAADLCEENIYPFATDAGPGRPGKDVLGTPGVSIEVKARADFNPVASLRQATSNAEDGETPIVVVRMNGQGPAHIDEWVAFTTWKEMKEFIKWKSGLYDIEETG